MEGLGLVWDFGGSAMEGLVWAGVLKSYVLKIWQPHSPTGGEKTSFCWFDKYITTLQVSWNRFDKCAVEKLSCATKNCGCCGRTKLSYSGISLVHVLRNNSGITLASGLWKSYFELLSYHSGECAGVCCGTSQASLWPVCCGRGTLSYSGITLASVLWKRYFGLLRDHSGITLASVP